MGVQVVNLSLRFISDLILWGKGRGSLSDSLAPGPGRDSDISEGLPGEPLSISSTLSPEGPLPAPPRHEPLPPGLCGLLSPVGR